MYSFQYPGERILKMFPIDKRSDGYYMNPLSPHDRAMAEIERARIDRYLRFRVMKKLQIPHDIYSLAMVPIVISGVFVVLMVSDGTILIGSIAIAACLLVMIGLIVTGRRSVSRKIARRAKLSSQIKSLVKVPDVLVRRIEFYTETYPLTNLWSDMSSALVDIASWRSRQFWRTVDAYNEAETTDDPDHAALLIRSAELEFDNMWRYLFSRQMNL